MPERPKPYLESLAKALTSNAAANREMFELVKRYNEAYVHWDELRRKALPTDPETVWALMKLTRESQCRHVEFHDIRLSFNMTSNAHRIVHMLDTGASGLMMVEEPLSKQEMDRYIVSSLMEEAIASSQIEGAVTTTKEAKRMLRENRKPRSRSERMILNDYLTMQRLKEIKDQPLTVETILELHRSITNGTLEDASFEGRFRTDDEVVVADPFELDKVYHQPPSFVKLQAYMEDLCRFANEKDDLSFQHPLVKSIILHFMIGYVHPFVDGNGRLARALMYWYGLKRNYWLFEYMAISKVIKASKGRYGMAYLHAETDDNDITYFINYNLECMEKALKNTRDYIARKQGEQREALKLISSHPELNFRQAEMLKDLIKRKGEPVSIMEIASKFNVVHQTARSDLLFLVEHGFLEKMKVGKRLLFRYAPNDNGGAPNSGSAGRSTYVRSDGTSHQ